MRFIRLLPLTVFAFAAPAIAEPLKSVPAPLDPAKAYILVEYRQQQNPLANFPGSRKYYPLMAGLSFARYDPVLADIRGFGRARANSVNAGEKPTEPFQSRELAKRDGARLFLLAVDPDLWVVQGWGNTSFSLGSYAFRLEPGMVTDLGVVTATVDWAEGDHPATAGDIVGIALLGPFAKRPKVAPARVSFRPRSSDDMAIPAGIPFDRVKPVAFTPDAKFGNYLGGLVNHIEGVNSRAKTETELPAK